MAIDLIRICGAFLIFLCHVCNESGSMLGSALGQIFNVGVPLFFMLSGYLHGLKGTPEHTLQWYTKKLERLLIPLYVFLAILFAVYYVNEYPINKTAWMQTALPICGLTQNYISGCGHMWFLTHLLICYFATPFLQRTRQIKIKPWYLMLGWSTAAIVLAYTVPPIWCTLWNSLFSYCVGFYIVPKLVEKRYPYIVLVCSALASCGFRLVFRAFLDGTPIYNTVATEVCSIVFAGTISVFLYQIANDFESRVSTRIGRILSAVSKRTYEFYLVHYIFLNGNLKIKISGSVWINAAISLVAAILLAEIIFAIKSIIEKKARKICNVS